MFENLSHLALQQYWWIIVSLLASFLVFLMFVQGGQTLLGIIGKTNTEKNILVNSIGRKWDITFTTLVTFGGAFFASFPLFYSTSFGGAYWVWVLILFSFIIQAVSYEYRSKAGNFLGTKTYDVFLFINGLLATILIGAAVGTFFTGSEFSIDKARILDATSPVISRWENSTHGLEAALNITNLTLGLSVFFLSRILASLYFINNIDNETIISRAAKQVKINAIPFLLTFLTFTGLLITAKGFSVDTISKKIFMEDYKYLSNFLDMPVVLIIFAIGVIGVLSGIYTGGFKTSKKAIWLAGTGTIFTVFAIFMIAGFNNTAFYPSSFNIQHSLTIENASSSHYTLTVMSYVSLLVPFVLGYIWFAWRAMNKKKINEDDIEKDDMAY